MVGPQPLEKRFAMLRLKGVSIEKVFDRPKQKNVSFECKQEIIDAEFWDIPRKDAHLYREACRKYQRVYLNSH